MQNEIFNCWDLKYIEEPFSTYDMEYIYQFNNYEKRKTNRKPNKKIFTDKMSDSRTNAMMKCYDKILKQNEQINIAN